MCFMNIKLNAKTFQWMYILCFSSSWICTRYNGFSCLSNFNDIQVIPGKSFQFPFESLAVITNWSGVEQLFKHRVSPVNINPLLTVNINVFKVRNDCQILKRIQFKSWIFQPRKLLYSHQCAMSVHLSFNLYHQ